MALQLNPYMKGTNGLIRAFLTSLPFNAATITIRLFPTTVSYPTFSVESFSSLPAGHIWTINNTSTNYTISGSSLIISSGTTSANTTAAGTFSWWSIHTPSTANSTIISDSIGLSGSGAIMSVSTMTPTSGQSVSIAFSLTIA